MRLALGTALVALFLGMTTYAQEGAKPKETVAQYVQDISVTIQAGRSQGSGVFKTTKDGQVWVVTCGHVVEDLRRTREVLDKGTKKTVIEFEDAKVRLFQTENGRQVSDSSFDAEVIRYSDIDHGEDLAVLRLRTNKQKPKSAKFYLDKTIPEVGEDLLHCGSLLGEFGSNSVTPGIVSQHGRLINSKVYDQTTCVSYPGSSGGAVVLKKDGRYVGMIVRGAVGGFNLMVPVRRMIWWAEQVGVGFVFDESKEIPGEEKLRSIPVEQNMPPAGGYAVAERRQRLQLERFPLLIQRVNEE